MHTYEAPIYNFVYSLQLEGQVITSIDLHIYFTTCRYIKQGEFTDITLRQKSQSNAIT